MSVIPQSQAADSYPERGSAFWLPPGGFGNGLPAAAWAQTALLAEGRVSAILAVLTEAGIPAHVDAAAGPRGFRDASGASGFVLWVDSHRYSAATDLLMDLLRRRPVGRRA